MDADPPQRRRLLDRSMMPVFVALTAALLAVGGLIAQTIYAERTARERAVQETDALFALQRLLQTALDAETGQRGYLLTGRDEYLAPYRSARRHVAPELAMLRDLADRSGAAVRPHAARLSAAMSTRMAVLDETVELAAQHRRSEALRLVESDIGRVQMDRIRAEVGWLVANETRNRSLAFRRALDTERRAILLLTLLGAAIVALVVAGFRAEHGRAKFLAEAEQAAALRDANARARLLARELNHRVKNLFSVVLSIVSISGRKTDAPTREVVEDIRARIRALALAHEVSQGQVGDGLVSEERVDLGEVIGRIMRPYATADGRITLNGPPHQLEVRAVTPLGLIVHELATNAAKYGALANETGRVSIEWSVRQNGDTGKELQINWIETGAPTFPGAVAEPRNSGYGFQMMGLAANQLGGRIDREWLEPGVAVRVVFPVA